MKLRHRPDDFRVEELTDAAPGRDGEFAFYRLDKTGWTTHDALAMVRRRWQLDFTRLSYGGLKDRHAVSSQHFTVYRGPGRDFAQDGVKVTYLGRRREPFTSNDIRANRFRLVLRSMSAEDVAAAGQALAEVAVAGLPNYFDDQRFGSAGAGGELVGREMVFGRWEKALWLALAAAYEFDPAEARAEKQLLRDKWADWPVLKAELPKGHARSLVDYLVHHPTDYKGAVARLRPDLQGLYLSAYQSLLWNRVLAAWLAKHLPPADLAGVDLKLGRVPVPVRVPDGLRPTWETLNLPLPSARVRPDPASEWAALAGEVLKGEGLTLSELKVKGMQKPFFTRGDRRACVRPEGLTHGHQPDDLHPGRLFLRLGFDLPRGSYATMLVKRITAAGPLPAT